MKLLLTSNGLSTESIAEKLFALVEKPSHETTIAFVPTAMNPTEGNKTWFVNDISRIHGQGLKQLDVVDFSALEKEEWLPRFQAADVLFFSGGDTHHLIDHMREAGLDTELPRLLETRVYAGISAGSIVTGPTTAVSSDDIELYYEDKGYKGKPALNFVPFHFRPHYNSPDFPNARKGVMEDIAGSIKETLYAVDDTSALAVVDGAVEIVGEGKVDVFNPNA
ncbi:type 1 glutamine amidotransferase-like domain-containing protein [Patescibacteria group bacterium]|nr:type 1 glutamine amidotransferase-like domain-containing protein [Patescibacteria group bacterium]